MRLVSPSMSWHHHGLVSDQIDNMCTSAPTKLTSPSLEHPLKALSLDSPTRHSRPNIPLESLPVHLQVLRCSLVQRITRVRLEEQKLQAHDDGVQVEHGLPIFAQNVEADLALEIDVGVVDLLLAEDFGRVVREILVDGEGEGEAATFVHAFVRLDCEREVEDVVRVGKIGLHGRAEGEFGKIFLYAELGGGDLLLLGS